MTLVIGQRIPIVKDYFELLFTIAKISCRVEVMSVKWLTRIAQEKNWTPAHLKEIAGVTLQAARKWLGITKVDPPPEGMNFRALCRIRQKSGKSWSQVGKMLDDEFLPRKKGE